MNTENNEKNTSKGVISDEGLSGYHQNTEEKLIVTDTTDPEAEERGEHSHHHEHSHHSHSHHSHSHHSHGHHRRSKKKKFRERFNQFINRNRMKITVVLLALALILLVVVFHLESGEL